MTTSVQNVGEEADVSYLTQTARKRVPRGSLTGSACKACNHPLRSKLELMLAQGVGPTAVAREFKLPFPSVNRHRKLHMGAAALDPASVALNNKLQMMDEVADSLLVKAKAAKNPNDAASAMTAAARGMDLVSRMNGDLHKAGAALDEVRTALNLTRDVGDMPMPEIVRRAYDVLTRWNESRPDEAMYVLPRVARPTQEEIVGELEPEPER